MLDEVKLKADKLAVSVYAPTAGTGNARRVTDRRVALDLPHVAVFVVKADGPQIEAVTTIAPQPSHAADVPGQWIG